MDYIAQAQKYRPIIEKAMQGVPDKEASEAPYLLPHSLHHEPRKELPAGFRVYWHGKVLKSKIPLWDDEMYDPDHSPESWQEIAYRDGYRIIPDVITVTEAFSMGERGWWGDTLYESLANANVYTPEQYPDNWKECA